MCAEEISVKMRAGGLDFLLLLVAARGIVAIVSIFPVMGVIRKCMP